MKNSLTQKQKLRFTGVANIRFTGVRFKGLHRRTVHRRTVHGYTRSTGVAKGGHGRPHF